MGIAWNVDLDMFYLRGGGGIYIYDDAAVFIKEFQGFPFDDESQKKCSSKTEEKNLF